MPKAKHSSPTLALTITAEQRAAAVASNSGGCLIADAIKKQYPNLTNITVDMATIRATDRQAGLRYVYLTPAAAQHVLLAFDQGWPNPTEQLTVRRAVQIVRVTARAAKVKATATRRAELEAKRAAGAQLTRSEAASLRNIARSEATSPPRPTSPGPTEVHVTSGGVNHGAVVIGGVPPVQGPAHPNLLRGRDRHFGAKLADPGQAFTDAVDAAVQEKLSTPSDPTTSTP